MCFGFGKWPLSGVDVTARLSIICSNRWWLYEREKKINLLKIININLFKNLLHSGTSCASCFFSLHFYVFCDLLPNIHVATRSLFVKCNKRLRDNSFLQVMRKSKDCGCHYPIQRSSKLLQLEASRYVFFLIIIFLQRKKNWLLWKESWNTYTSLCNQHRRHRG